jgi:hypothetical protein
VSEPLFVTVTNCLGFWPTTTVPKSSGVGDTDATAAMAMPLRVTGEGLGALHSTARLADLAVVEYEPTGGPNVTVTVCDAPPSAIVKVVGDTANSAESGPERLMPSTTSGAVPVSDTISGRLRLVPIRTPPKLSAAGATPIPGALGMPGTCTDGTLRLPPASTATSR